MPYFRQPLLINKNQTPSMGKFTFILLAIFHCLHNGFSQGAAINAAGTPPDVSAILDVSSSTQGFLPPRMSTAQRDAIVSPANGLAIFNTDAGCLNYYFSGSWNELCGSPVGSINSLNCGSANQTGTLTSGTAASGVSSSIPYSGGNGGTHNGQTVNSSGVSGLTATLTAGNFASGNGNLTYSISGTPATSGTADFALSIGGQTCTLSLTVNAPPTFPAGMVHCTANPTAIVDVVNPSSGKTWMDRNLGASQVAQSSTDANSYGDLYQWGRLGDGHQCRNSYTTTSPSNTNTPGHDRFITYSPSPYDWRIPQNANLWQGVNGVNNPCPSGYRVPTTAEFTEERQTWSSQNINGAFASPLKFSVTGFRSYTGNISSTGTLGSYWTSSPSPTDIIRSFAFAFDNSGIHETPTTRGSGMAVRCIKN